jgi:hypothetical protein
MNNPMTANRPPVLSDLAAAERELETYLARLTAPPAVPAEACLPFATDPHQATEAFNRWLASRSLVPGDLKTAARLGGLEANYVPFWVISSMTCSSYKGERGENYKDTEDYTAPDGCHKTREVRKVRWTPITGEVRHHFESVILCGLTSLSPEQATFLTPRDLRQLSSLNGAPPSGAPVEKYTLGPREIFNKARAAMDADLKGLIEKDIGGNERTVAKIETRHTGVTIKHVLVPMYRGRFHYRGKDYPILVNAATGEVTGEHPVSAGKVALVVLIFILIFAAIAGALYWFVIKPRLKHAEGPAPAAPAMAVACQPAAFPPRCLSPPSQKRKRRPRRARIVSDGHTLRSPSLTLLARLGSSAVGGLLRKLSRDDGQPRDRRVIMPDVSAFLRENVP